MSLATLFQEVESAFRPTGVNFAEKEDSFVLEAVIAGVSEKEIDVSLNRGSISIEAKGSRYSYSYLAALPIDQIDFGVTPEAVCENGILKITFFKTKAQKPLKIAITAK